MQLNVNQFTPHAHVMGELCPYCDQPIPNDRVAEIKRQFEEDQKKAGEVLEQRLAAEREALRQQLAVFKRKQARPKLRNLDRFFCCN